MNAEELQILQTHDLQQAIEQNLERDPFKIALDKHLPHASLVASQVKYLQRARKKIPAFYNSRCIIPSLSFEQSSSEQSAQHKNFSGETCIDLTCGLGIDTLALATKFNSVITVERDPILSQIAEINFKRLGVDNITVINDSAEDFIETFSNHVDLIYADPDRRGAEGKKLVRLEDCSPDITALLPQLRKAADHIAVKASPLFDVSEAFRIFGNSSKVTVISLNGECKEVLIESGKDITMGTICASVIGIGEFQAPHPTTAETAPFTPPYSYVIIPDVALRKARITNTYAHNILPQSHTAPSDGYIFTNQLPAERPLGRLFEIESLEEYSPSKLKKSLRRQGIKSAQIYLHNFPHTTAEICRAIGIKEGGTTKIAFTTIGTTLWSINLKELPLQ